jgi:peptidyl-prolyl cis-trans isomerase SurA
MKKSILICAAILVVAGALRADNIVDEIIARVNDTIITRSEYEKAKQSNLQELKQNFPDDWQTRWAKAEKDVLRDMIDQQLLLEKGKDLGITGETETVKRLNQMRQQMNLPDMDALEAEARKQGVSFADFKEQIRIGIVAQQVVGQEVGGKLHITNEEVQEFYNQHQKDLEGPEEVSLSEIMISTQPKKENVENKDQKDQSANSDKPLPEDPQQVAQAEAKAKSVAAQLDKGAKFEDLAKQFSDGQTAAQGGPLGAFKRGELAKELEDKTFSLKPGAHTDPIRTKQGFVILKVNQHRSAGIPPLKEVEDRIREAIYQQKLEPAARAYLSKLRDQAYIDVKQGFADTGSTGNNGNKPVIVAQNGDPNSKQGQSGLKKKKKFLLF